MEKHNIYEINERTLESDYSLFMEFAHPEIKKLSEDALSEVLRLYEDLLTYRDEMNRWRNEYHKVLNEVERFKRVITDGTEEDDIFN